MSLTEVSSGSPAVNISAKSVINRFPCFRRIKYASSQHWRNLHIQSQSTCNEDNTQELTQLTNTCNDFQKLLSGLTHIS